MALPRLLLAWLVITVWFVVWHEGRRRLGRGPAVNERMGISFFDSALEALLLVLFTSLWFASLGHGGWLLLFLLLAALIEIPVRLRQHRQPLLPWREVTLGMIRIVAAGGLLAWRLG